MLSTKKSFFDSLTGRRKTPVLFSFNVLIPRCLLEFLNETTYFNILNVFLTVHHKLTIQ